MRGGGAASPGAAVAAAQRAGAWPTALGLLARMERNSVADREAYTAAMATSGCPWPVALQLLAQLGAPDTAAYGAAALACIPAWPAALRVLAACPRPDDAVLAAAVRACAFGPWPSALQLLAPARTLGPVNAALFSVASSGAPVAAAEIILLVLRRAELKPDLCTALVGSDALRGPHGRSVRRLHAALVRGTSAAGPALRRLAGAPRADGAWQAARGIGGAELNFHSNDSSSIPEEKRFSSTTFNSREISN